MCGADGQKAMLTATGLGQFAELVWQLEGRAEVCTGVGH
jgi:hypothetical protein